MKLHTIKFTEKEINELFKLVLKYSLSNSLYVKLKKHVKEPELIYDESGTIIGEINDITEDDEKVENRHKFIDESIESNADGVFWNLEKMEELIGTDATNDFVDSILRDRRMRKYNKWPH